ncbi:MAG: CARDB domain-containing protein [Janthinobacterium lividum]
MKISTFLYTLFLSIAVGLLSLQPTQLRAQTYLLPATGTASYTTCAGTLYDDSGPDAPYSAQGTGSLTLRPGTVGSKLKLEFTVLEVDTLLTSLAVYDGTNTGAPLIGNLTHGRPTVYATSNSGALTFVLTSRGGLPFRGFAATISCYSGSPPPPDVAVQRLTVTPARGLAGNSVHTNARFANLSGGLSSNYFRYLLSTDDQVSADDVELDKRYHALAAGDWAQDWLQLQLPVSTAPGEYYLLCAAKNLVSQLDANQANNVVVVPFSVLTPTPTVDLGITLVPQIEPTPLAPGSALNRHASVLNLGTTLAVESQTGYFLSTDATWSANDVLLGTEPAIAYSSATITLPTSTAPGTYYLICVADYLDQVIEDDEQNNTFAQPVVVEALTIDAAFDSYWRITPTQRAVGDSLNVRCYLLNWGTVRVDAASVGYYLSTDRVLSSDDGLLGQTFSGPLLFGNYSSGYAERTLAIPAGTPPGKYYLLLVADYLNQLAESNETNNVLALALDVVLPNVDLAVGDARIYESVAGNDFGATCSILNRGTTTAYPVTVGRYLSTDALLSADDVFLGQGITNPITGGDTQEASFWSDEVITIPITTAPGPYYVIFVADYLHQIVETNEENNTMAVALQVRKPNADLVLSGNFTMQPARTAAGTPVQITYKIDNRGSTPVNSPTIGYYLSTDSVLSPDDRFIGSDKVRRGEDVSSSYSYERTSTPAIPRLTLPGLYYLLGVVDYLHEVEESDETNNTRYVPIYVTPARPDIKVLPNPYFSPKQGASGSSITTECYVYNVGTALANACQMGYYLSTDPVFSTNDVRVGSSTVGRVQAGYSDIVTGSFTIPATTTGGRYYVLFVADYLNQLDDSNLNNNLAFNPLTITGPSPAFTRPDLQMLANPYLTLKQGGVGSTVSTESYLATTGTDVAGTFEMGYYLSADSVFSTTDVLLSRTAISGAQVGALAKVTGAVTIPAGTAAGQYYVLFVADHLNQLDDSNRRNNCRFTSFTVIDPTLVPARPDLSVVAKPYLSAGQGKAGSTISTESYLYNLSTAIASRFEVGYYLSTDSLLSTNDLLLASTTVYGVKLGASVSAVQPFTIPTTIAAGRYYVLVVADYLNQVDDSNRSNNIGYTTFIVPGLPLATREQTAGYELRILPVPVAGPTPLHVQLSGAGTRADATLALYNSMGQRVSTQVVRLIPGATNQAAIQTAGLATGVYILRLTGPGLNATRRVVVE